MNLQENEIRPVSDHLTELRRRIVWIAVVFLGALCCSFYFSIDIFRLIRDYVFMDKTIFARSPGDPLRVYMQISFLLAFVLTIPVIMYHVWRFALPGLTKKEQHAVFLFIPIGILLFIVGIGFGSVVVFPFLIDFLNELNIKMGLTQMYGIYDAFSFFTNIVVPLGLLFELPVIVLFLTSLGFLTPKILRDGRRYAYFSMVVLSALIAPPDLVSNVLIVLPLFLLYELSILLSQWMEKREKIEDES